MVMVKMEKNLEDAEHVYVMPSYIAVLWERGRFNEWFYKKVSSTSCAFKITWFRLTQGAFLTLHIHL